jgi:hypothetical protein
MKNNIKIALLSILTISIFSCEKEVEIDIDETEQKLVLNTWLKADESPEVQISYSSFIFNKSGTGIINNARVILLEEGNEIGDLNYSEQGLYTNENISLKNDTNYELEVIHEDYQSIFSAERIPSKVEDNEIDISYQVNPNANYSGNTYRSTISINIKDDATEENYYLARVAQIDKYWSNLEEDTSINKNYVYMEPMDPQTQDTYLPNSGGHFVLSDEIFNGKEYEMKLGGFNDVRKYEAQNDSIFHQIVYHEIELHKINRALYLYLISIDNNQYPGPFTEPTQIYSNVENGYGIVGTSSFIKYVIEESYDDDF